MSTDSANDFFTSTDHDDDDEFRIGKDGPANFKSNTEQFADRQQIKECKRCAKMEMELKEAKHLQTIAKLEFENKALQEKLKQQEMMAEINALQAKVAKLEKEQQKEKEGKYVVVEKFDALFGKVAEIEKQQQQKVTALEENQKKLDNFIGILKDRFGNELLNAVHPKVRQNIAEKFSIPYQNCLDVNACHNDLEIFGPNCLQIYFKSNGSGFRSVFAKHPIPCSESAGIFYFEMKIIIVKNLCSVGFFTKAMPLDGRVGQNSDGCAYQSDGQFWANGSNNVGMPNYSHGDFVGCGINLTTQRIIFTKNGHPLDTANFFLSLSSADFPLFPFVSLNDSGDLIDTNFGPQFKFDPAKVQNNLPRENYWDANFCCHENLEIIGNKSLIVHHKGNTSDSWRSVFAKYPILLNKPLSDFFYYEISVIKKAGNYRLMFGFSVKQQKKFEVAMLQSWSYVYYSSDFFVASSFADDLFHPLVSLRVFGDKIEANFGPNFKFDLATL